MEPPSPHAPVAPVPPQGRAHPLDWAAAVGFVAYASTATITPICLVILAKELRFSLAAAGTLEVVRSLLAVGIMVASGFLAGWFGKVRSLGAATLLLGFGMMVYSAAPSYGVVVIALALLGVGGGVTDALINPLVQDLHPGDSGRYLNIVNAFWSIGVLGTMLISGELLTHEVSWRFLAAGVGALAFFSGALFLLLQNTKPRDKNQRLREVFAHKTTILRKRGFWLFFWALFVAGAVEGAFTFWSASLIQLEYGGRPRAAGIAAAFFATGMIAGRLLCGWRVRQEHLWHLLFFSALAGLPVSILVPFAPGVPVAAALLFLAGLATAALWPSIQSYAADRLHVDSTALFILLSCGGIPGFAFSPWIMGLVGEHANLRVAFWCVPPLFVALLALLWQARPAAGGCQSR